MSLARFDEIAGLFDQVTETPLHRRLCRSIVFALGELPGRTVLDVGAGPGGLTRDLVAAGARVVTLDGAPEMLRLARERVAEGPVALLRGDASALPLAGRTVDHAAGMLVLHLLDDPVPALVELRRVVRPGGRLAFLTQSIDFGPESGSGLREPLDPVEARFLEGCARSAGSHPRLDRDGWHAAFRRAGLPTPTITRALPGVAWLLFAQLPST